MMELIGNVRFIFVWQVFLLLASILVSSTILNDVPANPVSKYKYYSNKKGTQVVEIGPENLCEIFVGDDAAWLRDNKGDEMTMLNYIQFRLLVGKCQLDAIFKPLMNSHELPNNHITTFETPDHKNDTEIQLNPSSNNNNNTKRNATSEVKDEEKEKDEEESSVTTMPSPVPSSSPKTPTMPLIFPGTKWCGAGSSARYHDDLGLYVHTDKCCRDHDLCPENMAGKKCKYGLCNDSEYTRSSCDCDYEFRMCLQKDRSLSSLASFKIANLYFNILKPLCYARRPPVKSCRRHRITGECVDFEFDSEYDQEWQFFPAQPYLSEAVENLIQPLLPPLPLIANPNEEDRVQLLSPNPNRNESQTTKKPSTNEEDDDDEEEEEPSNEEEDGDSDNEDRNSKRNDRKVLGVTDKLVVIPINEG